MKLSHFVLVVSSAPFVAATLLPAQTIGAAGTDDPRTMEIRALHQELNQIQSRLAALERSVAAGGAAAGDSTGASGALTTSSSVSAESPRVAPSPDTVAKGSTTEDKPAATDDKPPVLVTADQPMLDLFRGTTLNFMVDGYYGYNFNVPVGRVNLLRAYDVTSNSFNLNQVDFMIERVPTKDSRFGGRVDLMFGQATETLQGSSVNEQRPQVWRNLYQAYGSYLAPVGSGVQIDFGKWASSLGNEGNYSKDQTAYSRGYSFNYLPFYHTGLRTNYNVTSKVNVAYWLVNGANDTEDLNGSKSQAFAFTLKPASTLTWNVNYYFGNEGRDVATTLNPRLPVSPTQPGLPTANITPAPNRREHIFDPYATWQSTKKLALTGEADYVVNRTFAHTQPSRVVIGEVAGKYAISPTWNAGFRTEYFDDRGGLFSGKTQALKEETVVLDHTFAPGFLAKAEYRRDWSNQQFFLSDTPGALKHAQSTATVGLIYWWGTKQGAW